MRLRERDTLDLLEADLIGIAKRAPGDMRACVRDGIKAGNVLAQDYAKISAGDHGKHYPKAFSAEMRNTFGGFGTMIHSGEYGPDIAKPQGGMSFERGSRNQKPHLDLARSADRIAPSFEAEVGRLPDKWFRGFGRQRGRLF